MSKKKRKLKAGGKSKKIAAPQQQMTTRGGRDSDAYMLFAGSSLGTAGVHVNERNLMSVASVVACVELLAGSLASCPLHIYEDRANGRRRADHPYSDLLNKQSSPRWTAAAAWQHDMHSKLLRADGFRRIFRQGATAFELEPLNPCYVEPFGDEGRAKYYIQYPRAYGEFEVLSEVVDQDDMLHFPGVGFDGLRSLTPLTHWLRTVGSTSIAADQYSAAFFANSARPDFALTTDGIIDEEQEKRLREQFEERYGGASNSHKPAVLGGGLKLERITMTSEDAQLLNTRQFQVEEIARIHGVPPPMIGHTANSTEYGSGMEQQSIWFVKYSLRRHLNTAEQEVTRKLFPRGNLFAEFQTAGLERADINTRYGAYRSALGRAGEPGWLTPNEVRRIENVPPSAGGDELHGVGNDDTAEA